MELNIKDLKLNYEIYGEGTPILMLHGYTPDHRLMSGCLEPIFKKRRNYRRIYIDLPGMGRTKAMDWLTNSDTMLDIVIQFIEKVIPNERFLLAGESYGGYLSRGLVRKMPGRILGLLLICPCIIADRTKRTRPEHIVLESTDIPINSEDTVDFEDYGSMAVIRNERTWERYQKDILCGLKLADNEFLEHFQNTGYEYSKEIENMPEYLKTPVLFLLGRQDASVGYKDAWDILDNYPRGTFAVLDKAGHNLQIEQDLLFQSLVNEWLDRVETN